MTQPHTRGQYLDRTYAWAGSLLLLIVGVGITTMHARSDDPWALTAILPFGAALIAFLMAVLALLHLVFHLRWPVVRKARKACAGVGRFVLNIAVSAWTLLFLLALRTIEFITKPPAEEWAEETHDLPTNGARRKFVNRIRRRLDAERSRPLFHRAAIDMQRWGHGDEGRRFYSISIVLLIPIWFFGTLAATYVNLPEGDANRLADSAYRTVLTLGGTDNLLTLDAERQADDNPLAAELAVMRWFGLLLPFLIGLPPLFRWLIRINERMNAEHALSDHYVILGYGQVGSALARDILNAVDDDPVPVIVVENTIRTEALDAIRRHGALVLEQSADDNEVLSRVGAHRARGILVATGASSRNIDITGRLAREITARRERDGLNTGPLPKPPRLVPHIAERPLMDWVASQSGEKWRLGQWTSQYASSGGLRPSIWPFSADQTAVRQSLDHRSVAEHARLRGVRRAHIVILGFDSVAQWLLPRLLQAGRGVDLHGPRITVVRDRRAETDQAAGDPAWRTHNFPFLDDTDPATVQLCEHLEINVRFQEYDFDQIDRTLLEQVTPVAAEATEVAKRLTGDAPPMESLAPSDAQAACLGCEDPVTTIFVCFGDDQRNLNVALRLREAIARHRLWRAPIFARLFEDSGLDEVLSRSERETALDRVVDDFGQNAKTCTREEIFNPPRDHAAQEVHHCYALRSAFEQLARRLGHIDSPTLANGFKAIGLSSSLRASPQLQADLHHNRITPDQAIQRWLADFSRQEAVPFAGEVNHAVRLLLRAIDPQSLDDGEDEQQPTDRGWDALQFPFVKSTREQADHLPEKLRGMGYRACPHTCENKRPSRHILGPWPVAGMIDSYQLEFRNEWLAQSEAESPRDEDSLVPEPIERAAKLEHERYVVDRLGAGWRYGSERDNLRRRHPSLRPYEDLRKSPAEQRKDRSAVINSHSALAREGMARYWYPECKIGVLVQNTLQHTHPIQATTSNGTDVIASILFAIVNLETRALEHTFRPGNEMEASRSGVHAALDGDLALCALADLTSPASRELVAGLRQWTEAQDAHEHRYSKFPFRTIVPKASADENQPSAAEINADACLRQTGATEPALSDCWKIDLQPEGLPQAVARLSPAFKWPTRDADSRMQYWSDEASADQEKEDVNNRIRALRGEFYNGYLLPRVTAYIVERSDWLIVFHCAEPEHDDTTRKSIEWRCGHTEVPAWCTSLPGGRERHQRPLPIASILEVPPAGWQVRPDSHAMLVPVWSGTDEEHIEFDLENRLVCVRLSPAMGQK